MIASILNWEVVAALVTPIHVLPRLFGYRHRCFWAMR
jgi:hypothetical protein